MIAVGICTYNRRILLGNAILSLQQQSLKKTAYEIVILDDGSTDGTGKMIREIQKKHPLPKLRYLRTDGNTGLAHGRNIVVTESPRPYIAFIDDDAIADAQWLSRGLGYFDSVKKEIYGVTGPVFPYYEDRKPAWFKDEYEHDVKKESTRFLRRGETFSGPNMILRRDVILRFGGFNEQTDMRGDILALGEETSLFARIWEQDSQSRLYYAPDVIVRHIVHPYKMTLSYRLKRWVASGQAYVAIHRHKPFVIKLAYAGKVIGYLGYSSIAAIVSFPFYQYWQQWVVERIGPLCFIIGYIISVTGISFSVRHAART